MKKLLALGLLTMAFLVLPAASQAQGQLAYTAKNAHLRAGPARDYPVIAILPAGFEVLVQGCLSDYSWCDVIAGPDRGWVYAGNLDYAYEGGYVPLLDYGPQIGIGITGFFLFDYWDRHYRDRPFYRDRDGWAHRPRPPQPPIVRPLPPRHGEPGGRLPPPGPGGPGPHPRPPPRNMPGELPRPPQHGRPGEPHQPPPQHGSPGTPRPQPPPHGSPGGPRPPPRSEGPVVVRPRPQ